MLIFVEDTTYSSADEKAEFITQEIDSCIEECLAVIKYSEEIMLESLVHFCNTGKFLDD
ncbi:MAG: hypothetical protein HGA35_04990 [Erysipelotrichaceae bacterium]|nr:hypothetical protein [Erysipelotrichaceae bacterium]